ncbi:MAG: CpaD family pilus assembly lipoprotein [Pseudomonadota bacterium]
MKKTHKALHFLTLGTIAIIAGCASGGRESNVSAAQQIQDTRTILDAVTPEVRQVEARLLISGENGHLSAVEMNNVRAFVGEYQRLGRGNIIVTYPQGTAQDGMAQNLVRELQRQIYANGVEFTNMGFGPYQAHADQISPIIVSFDRYEVRPVECTPWTQIDPRKTANNQATERFGCAQRANLAAMVVDPGDLIGDRREGVTDAQRPQVGIEALRKGELKQVSGAVSGGSN